VAVALTIILDKLAFSFVKDVEQVKVKGVEQVTAKDAEEVKVRDARM
jgi:hypothetical protein